MSVFPLHTTSVSAVQLCVIVERFKIFHPIQQTPRWQLQDFDSLYVGGRTSWKVGTAGKSQYYTLKPIISQDEMGEVWSTQERWDIYTNLLLLVILDTLH
jgi:hypothetical protein